MMHRFSLPALTLGSSFGYSALLLCASSLQADTNVRAWGYNGWNQTTIPSDLSLCTEIAGGYYFTLALTPAGGVRGWGANDFGQTTIPTNLGICTQISAGIGHSFAMASDGAVTAWGRNDDGQSTVPSDLGGCVQIACGGYHTIAITQAGEVRAWGSNSNGQSTVPSKLGACTLVAGGNLHSIVQTAAGVVRAWGQNANGQTNVPSNLGVCTQIAGGGDHTIALTQAGVVRAWGRNNFGQITIPTNLGVCTEIEGGYDHTVALTAAGEVRAWGRNNYTQITIPSDLGACLQISAGGFHTIAIERRDCNGNGIDDTLESAGNDCDADGILDSCEMASGAGDCDSNGVLDSCDISAGFEQDCDGNGTPDRCDIFMGSAPDANQNCTPDSCEYAMGDFALDGAIGGDDLASLLSLWGTNDPVADLTDNGVVEGGDLAMLLSNWGPTPYAGAHCIVPAWATVLNYFPDPAVVTNASLRSAIRASGYPWRVRDNGSQIELLLVPPGTFDMGCIQASNNHGCATNELPVHTVTLTNAYYMGRYEVTQAQWQAKLGSNPAYFQFESDSPSHPVELVSWNTVQSYLSATGMRLPTEAEWEHAYRAGTTTAFHSMPGYLSGTNDDAQVGSIAWYGQNACLPVCVTGAVGGKAANALGLHDMAGNVREWVKDWYGPYSSGAAVNPTGPVFASSKILRGGGYHFDSSGLRSSYREPASANFAFQSIGFRVARSPQ